MKLLQIIYFSAGLLMVFLGIIGLALPIVPTVPFLLAATWFFDRSSPRFHNWLINHAVFGEPIRRWKERRAISIIVKSWAVGSMAFGFLLFIYLTKPALWIILAIFSVLALISTYILTRPSE